jgi:hypothetical protein
MDETYRMLGREHDADLEREAARRRLAAQLPRSGRLRMPSVLAPAADALGRLLREFRRAPAAPDASSAPQIDAGP